MNVKFFSQTTLSGKKQTSFLLLTQSAGTEEYTDCISAEECPPHNEWPRYNIYQSDREAPVMLEL